MQSVLHDPPSSNAGGGDEQDPVREQLDRLLRSVHFRNSRRYPALLQHIVEQALTGHRASLKERTLGHEVFGRAADYDTAADPIVRVTVAEIRKRIAQYYHDEAHQAELRIELNPGSYIPSFLPPRQEQEPLVLPQEVPVEPVLLVERESASLPPAPAATAPRPWFRRWLPLAGLTMAVLALLVAVFLLRASPTERLWSPIFSEPGPITFCLPMSAKKNGVGTAVTTDQAIAHVLDMDGVPTPAGDGTFFDHELLGENVVYSDVVAMLKLDSVVEQQHRPVRVRLNVSSNLNDFREGPTIFIGGLDNQWTLRLLEPLRYRFAGSDADEYYIRDTEAPADRRWSVRLQQKMTVVNRDYALIARVHSPSLERTVMVVAGIGMSGTAAAGEFLSDPAQIRELERRIGYSNRGHDFEAVLETDVDDGIAGAARIVALDVR